MESKEKSFSIVSILPQIVLIIVMLSMTARYYVKGGIAPVNVWFKWMGYVVPFSLLVVVIGMIVNELRNVANKGRGMVYSVVTLVSYVIFTYFAANPEALGGINIYLTDSVFSTGNIAVAAVVGISYLTAFFRVYLAKTPLTAMLIILTFLSLMVWTPLGDMIWPPLTFAGQWIHSNVSTAGDGGWWIAAYIGMGALMVRVLIGREKLRPT